MSLSKMSFTPFEWLKSAVVTTAEATTEALSWGWNVLFPPHDGGGGFPPRRRVVHPDTESPDGPSDAIRMQSADDVIAWCQRRNIKLVVFGFIGTALPVELEESLALHREQLEELFSHVSSDFVELVQRILSETDIKIGIATYTDTAHTKPPTRFPEDKFVSGDELVRMFLKAVLSPSDADPDSESESESRSELEDRILIMARNPVLYHTHIDKNWHLMELSEQVGCQPPRVLFFDDTANIVEMAKSDGFNAFRVSHDVGFRYTDLM
eukprot:TRINITY_DN2137_c0_g1_i1.p1 TRINITY_DN2137_c0_g1~~TRINITY_DN2137_c0_g1_i1.p1  ORF type:complete len:267 (+),score=62.97 TRINITY_DN2137_c0_g1_i1:81-881(+)